MATDLAPTTKIFRAVKDSPASIMIEEQAVSLIGTASTFTKVDQYGTTTRGPESHINMGPQRRVGGMWVQTTEFLDMIPETIVTPFATNLLLMPPVNFVANMAPGLAFFAAMLA